MIFLFNIGDMVGKWLGGLKYFLKISIIYTVIVLRFIFFPLFILTARGHEKFQSDYFAFFNILLFGITNGFGTTSLMVVGPLKTNDPRLKDLINYIIFFMLTFGNSIGSILSVVLS